MAQSTLLERFVDMPRNKSEKEMQALQRSPAGVEVAERRLKQRDSRAELRLAYNRLKKKVAKAKVSQDKLQRSTAKGGLTDSALMGFLGAYAAQYAYGLAQKEKTDAKKQEPSGD